ncbi:hypothetical protein OSB04_016544 [Centaurea solstitialis]|uniref:Uncharacterized protein n=1 Tax=Centaurea solstitialis TaxID=347529 RepID=A0AA38WJT9_9ASTR|nr:hypothetical protein OSB04_016544 [Centaurea solstitialis]
MVKVSPHAHPMNRTRVDKDASTLPTKKGEEQSQPSDSIFDEKKRHARPQVAGKVAHGVNHIAINPRTSAYLLRSKLRLCHTPFTAFNPLFVPSLSLRLQAFIMTNGDVGLSKDKAMALHPAYTVMNIQTKIRILDGNKVTMLSNELMVRILESDTTAQAAWNKLKTNFLNNKNSRAATLEQEFSNLTLGACSSMEA